ncbi:hypothetical protein T484DRAFT_1795842 [Baffinella frigidus]|nr:hypothetical protein T484DRAFT_1795842 [Cryptophyta sp. CCMP2293]
MRAVARGETPSNHATRAESWSESVWELERVRKQTLQLAGPCVDQEKEEEEEEEEEVSLISGEEITEALLRGRAEHNDRSLGNLKEISLHQQNLEGVNRALTRLCPEIEILYLQHNLISKIENLKRLRDLDYLNMALNNVSRIEGLERNEKLRKLDLTVNFIDKLRKLDLTVNFINVDA